jgi:Protein of unknown function (DUF3987)
MRALSNWLDSFMQFTDNTEPPEMYRLWTGISVLAAALQRKCFIGMGSKTYYPNLYVVLVGPPATRKSTAMEPGINLLQRPGVNVKLAAQSVTREALIRELKNSAEMYTHSNGQMAYHSSLTIFSSEFSVFLGSKNSALIRDLCDWFDCSSQWTYRTKNMGDDVIVGVWLNIMGAITPDVIPSAIPSDILVGGGFTSRVIFVYEDKKGKTVADTSYTKEEELLREHLGEDLEQVSILSGQFRYTKKFITSRIDWYVEYDKSPPVITDVRFQHYLGRRHDFVMKLCMILCAARTDSMVIDECDLVRALEILELTERKMPLALSGVGKSNYAAVLPQVMVFIAQKGECYIQDIMTAFRHDLTKYDLDRILDTLETMRFCAVIHTGKIVHNPHFDKQGNPG